MKSLPPRLAKSLVLAVAVCGVLALGASPCLAVDIDGAEQDLEQLKKSMKSKGTNADILQYLDAVFTNYKELKLPEEPADDAPDEIKKAWESELRKAEKDREKYRDSAEKEFLKAMTLVKVKDETNIRDEVNIRAATILGELAPHLDEKGRESLSNKIVKAIDKKLTKVKTHDLNTDLLDAAFAALGHLNDEDSLSWMLDEHCHANEVQKEYIVAAHKAMVLFKDVPGKLRYEICEQFVKIYGAVEGQAEKSSSDPKDLQKKRFWDDIKTYTIPVVQYYAGKPTDAEGSALATMKDFTEFMREYKNPRKAPWVDPKEIK